MSTHIHCGAVGPLVRQAHGFNTLFDQVFSSRKSFSLQMDKVKKCIISIKK